MGGLSWWWDAVCAEKLTKIVEVCITDKRSSSRCIEFELAISSLPNWTWSFHPNHNLKPVRNLFSLSGPSRLNLCPIATSPSDMNLADLRRPITQPLRTTSTLRPIRGCSTYYTGPVPMGRRHLRFGPIPTPHSSADGPDGFGRSITVTGSITVRLALDLLGV